MGTRGMSHVQRVRRVRGAKRLTMYAPSSLHCYAVTTAVATFFLLLAGSLVTSTDSGLAVPDWPLSYGMWFPPMVGGIFYEHGHRMIAAIVGMLIAALAIWLWRSEPRRWVRIIGYTAVTAVVVQACLGGATVLLLLPPAVSIAHACLGQTVFCLVVCLAWATSSAWSVRPVRIEAQGASSSPLWATTIAVVAALQLMFGAIIRHTGGGLRWHLGGAIILMGVAGWFVWHLAQRRGHCPTLWPHALRLLGVLSGQLLLGLAVFMHRNRIGLSTGHVALGALVLAQAIVLAWETYRVVAIGPTHAIPYAVSVGVRE